MLKIPGVPDEHQVKAHVGIGLGSLAALFYGIDPESFSQYLSAAASHQFTQMTLTFTFAAWVHQAGVRKEIASQMTGMKASIDGVAAALRLDLAEQKKVSDKIVESVTELQSDMGEVKGRIQKLETAKT